MLTFTNFKQGLAAITSPDAIVCIHEDSSLLKEIFRHGIIKVAILVLTIYLVGKFYFGNYFTRISAPCDFVFQTAAPDLCESICTNYRRCACNCKELL